MERRIGTIIIGSCSPKSVLLSFNETHCVYRRHQVLFTSSCRNWGLEIQCKNVDILIPSILGMRNRVLYLTLWSHVLYQYLGNYGRPTCYLASTVKSYTPLSS